jgi:hypothetical protein
MLDFARRVETRDGRSFQLISPPPKRQGGKASRPLVISFPDDEADEGDDDSNGDGEAFASDDSDESDESAEENAPKAEEQKTGYVTTIAAASAAATPKRKLEASKDSPSKSKHPVTLSWWKLPVTLTVFVTELRVEDVEQKGVEETPETDPEKEAAGPAQGEDSPAGLDQRFMFPAGSGTDALQTKTGGVEHPETREETDPAALWTEELNMARIRRTTRVGRSWK